MWCRGGSVCGGCRQSCGEKEASLLFFSGRLEQFSKLNRQLGRGGVFFYFCPWPDSFLSPVQFQFFFLLSSLPEFADSLESVLR